MPFSFRQRLATPCHIFNHNATEPNVGLTTSTDTQSVLKEAKDTPRYTPNVRGRGESGGAVSHSCVESDTKYVVAVIMPARETCHEAKEEEPCRSPTALNAAEDRRLAGRDRPRGAERQAAEEVAVSTEKGLRLTL